MSAESKEKSGTDKTVKVLIELPAATHERVMKVQATVGGRRGRLITIAEACTEIIVKGTKNVKVSQ
jgi:hypothetical protein